MSSGKENFDISRTTAGCIQHGVSVKQRGKNPLKSGVVSGMYGVHEAAYHALCKWTQYL